MATIGKVQHGGNTAGIVDATAAFSDAINADVKGTNKTTGAAALPIASPVAMEALHKNLNN